MKEKSHICAYCGQEAQYQLNNGKWCCQPNHNKCPAIRNKNSNSSNKLVNKKCPYCLKEFQETNAKIFANHVRWCSKNPKREQTCGKTFKEKLTIANQLRVERKFGPLKEFKVHCNKCGKEFIVIEREKKFPSKTKYFCSSKCNHSREHSEESKTKISNGVKIHNKEYGYYVHYKLNPKKDHIIKLESNVSITKICKHCGKEFVVKNNSKKQYCSISCSAKHRELTLYNGKLASCKNEAEREKLELKKYRQQCAFSFALNAYPEEFDFDLIREHGWYKAKNHGDNQNGVSRDHMYSVKDGFINHIDPKIISHPANCKLLLHSQNSSKKDKSSITLEELLQRIEKWNKKYGKII